MKVDLGSLSVYERVVVDTNAKLRFSRDPDDDAFIHVAVTAKVNRLISGDEDLLCLHPLGDLQILSPRTALVEINQINSSRATAQDKGMRKP